MQVSGAEGSLPVQQLPQHPTLACLAYFPSLQLYIAPISGGPKLITGGVDATGLCLGSRPGSQDVRQKSVG